MFGSGKIKELEARLSEMSGKLGTLTKEKENLQQELNRAREKVSSLEEKLKASESEALNRELKGSIAEYEGLKELYQRKNEEFDTSRKDREEEFARKAATDRFNLENEIQDNRQANRDYVTRTVKTFNESYQYYLNQIRMLMDALGEVTARVGEGLFTGEEDDLKAKIGQQMAEKLKEDTDPLRGTNNGDLILLLMSQYFY